MSSAPDPGPGPVPRTRRGRRAVRLVGLTATVVVGLSAVAYAADVAVAGDRVARGTRVAGIDIGGLERPVAARRLTAGLADREVAPIAVDIDGDRFRVDPVDAGLSLDVTGTLDRAGTGGFSPIARLRGLLGTHDVEPVVTVDEARLRAAVTDLAARVDRPAREGAVGFDGVRPKSVDPQTGRTLLVADAAAALRAGYLRTAAPIDLPVTVVPVKSTAAGVAAAVRDVAVPAVSAGVEVLVPGGPGSGDEPAAPQQIVVPPTAVGAALSIPADPKTGVLTPRIDPARLRSALAESLAAVEVEPLDASFRVVDGRPEVVPGRDGLVVDDARLAAALLPALTRPAPRVVTLALTGRPPALTTADAAALGIREKIGTFTTRHPCCRPRVTNIHRMADLVDGHVVLPGEEFSLNTFIGPRTKAKGFVEAPQILEGEFVDRVGGGVSQFATTIFNAVFFSGLEDVQHTPHSYYISRYPAGRESTVSFPQPDFRFRNDSPHGVLIETSYTSTSVTVTFYGTKRFDIESVSGPRTRVQPFTTQEVRRTDCTASSGAEGFDITVTRIFKQNGTIVKREPFKTRYKPEPKFVCVSPDAPNSAPSAKPSPTAAPKPAPSPTPTG